MELDLKEVKDRIDSVVNRSKNTPVVCKIVGNTSDAVAEYSTLKDTIIGLVDACYESVKASINSMDNPDYENVELCRSISQDIKDMKKSIDDELEFFENHLPDYVSEGFLVTEIECKDNKTIIKIEQ